MKTLNKHHILLLFAAFLACASPCLAGTSATLQVGATIKPWMKFNSIQHVATYQVSSDDLKKGYIELTNVITVNLSTNLTKGVRVLVANSGVGEVLLKESGTVDFSASSFTVSSADYRAGTQISKQYDSRITLPADAKVGTYPLTLTLMPTI